METITEKQKVLSLLCDPVFDRVLVACHASPDGDACGSAHALVWALRKLGKQANVFCADPFGPEFSYLTDEIQPYEFEPEHFVTVDIADPKMLSGAFFTDSIHIAIDHHRINSVSALVKLVLPERSSCGEIVLDLIRDLGVQFDSYLAKALYTAIATDTGCFRYSNTDENTFLAAAYLASFAEKGDFYRINKALFETKSRLQVKLESFAIDHVQYAKNGKIAYLFVSRACQKELGAQYSDLDCLINVIRQIEGVQVSLVIKEKEEGTFKVSVRSEAGFDAAGFCSCFGGGGHLAAAGCTLVGEATDAIRRLVEEAERSFA